MDHSARDAYLEAQIMTATPQKLRLMLIEAGLRHARAAYESERQQRWEESFEAATRCRRIVTELISGIDPQYSQLNRQVVALYVYLFQSLTEGQLRHDPSQYQNVVRVLEIERETWKQVCDKMPLVPSNSGPGPSREITAQSPAILPSLTSPVAAGSFSLDA